MHSGERHLLGTIRVALWSIALLILLLGVLMVLLYLPAPPPGAGEFAQEAQPVKWYPPDSTSIPLSKEGDLIRYGRELIAHTAVYLGPRGQVFAASNGMNCQNCHLKAGKKPEGNNYAAVASTYPKFRGRSGTMEQIEKRVNDCIQRSLNGRPLEPDSRELNAIVAYIRWVGGEVRKGEIPPGSGIPTVTVLDRAADPSRGSGIYLAKCARCHGDQGDGLRKENGIEWLYPPLWGDQSFNTGAGILRLSRMAGFVRWNMPNDIKNQNELLRDEDAWDVAAFICSQPRPTMDLSKDWPDISLKPFDHPFGPYSDDFSEQQHKFGPFRPILEAGGSK